MKVGGQTPVNVDFVTFVTYFKVELLDNRPLCLSINNT